MTSRILAGLMLSTVVIGAGAPASDPLQEQKDRALALLESLNKGDFPAAGQHFDETMAKVLPKEKLEATWKSVNNQLGAFKTRSGIRAVAGSKNDIVFVTCEFAKQTLDLKVAFDKEKRITGFFFVPTRPREFSAPAYANRDAFLEEEVVVGKDSSWPLPGTLTLPKGDGKHPALILLHGSGPLDRDETVFANKPFRDLAWGLASQGVAVLRYEKRTKAHGPQFAALKEFTIQQETVDDARAAIALLRNHSAIDARRIFIAGHSLGAVAAPLVGAQEPELAGIFVMAGNSRPLEDLILEQYRYIFSLKGELSDNDRQELEKIQKQAARVKDPALAADTASSALPIGIPAPYWLFLRKYDDVATAARLTMPVFIMQGERDYQVTMDDFVLWKKGLAERKGVTFKSYPKLNHLFIEGTGKSRPEEYDLPGHVSTEVIDDIATWIRKPK